MICCSEKRQESKWTWVPVTSHHIAGTHSRVITRTAATWLNIPYTWGLSYIYFSPRQQCVHRWGGSTCWGDKSNTPKLGQTFSTHLKWMNLLQCLSTGLATLERGTLHDKVPRFNFLKFGRHQQHVRECGGWGWGCLAHPCRIIVVVWLTHRRRNENMKVLFRSDTRGIRMHHLRSQQCKLFWRESQRMSWRLMIGCGRD